MNDNAGTAVPRKRREAMEMKPGYKEFTNYFRNELGITRDYIEQVVEKSIANTVKQAIVEKMENTPIDRLLRETIQALTTDTVHCWNTQSTKEKFEKAVYAEVKKQVAAIFEHDFGVEVHITPK